MENLMSEKYGGQPLPQRPSNKQVQQNAPEKPAGQINRSPHQSMAEMMTLVEDMYSGNSEQPQALLQTNTNQPTENASRRTRQGSSDSSTGGDGEQVKQAFKQWLLSFDQAVTGLDGTDKAKGDAMWKDVVDCVDSCWKAYTEQGQLP